MYKLNGNKGSKQVGSFIRDTTAPLGGGECQCDLFVNLSDVEQNDISSVVAWRCASSVWSCFSLFNVFKYFFDGFKN